MGKKPDEIEREIRDSRARISAKLTGLQERLEGDMSEAIGAVKDEASGIFGKAEQTLQLDRRMQDSPMTVLGTGLGLGVLLGVAGDSFVAGADGHKSTSNGSNGNGDDSKRDSGGGAIGGALAAVTGLAGEVVAKEIRQFVRTSLYGADEKGGER